MHDTNQIDMMELATLDNLPIDLLSFYLSTLTFTMSYIFALFEEKSKRTNREICNALDRIAENPPEPGMSRLATKRIQNELAAMQNDPPPGCVLSEMGDDIFRLDLGLLNIAIAEVLRLGMSVSYCV